MKVSFSDVLEIRNGRNQKAVENPNGTYPIYGSGGMMGRADDYICPANTVVIGRKGSINNPIFVEEPFWNVDTAFGLVADETRLLPRYLYYFCVHFDFDKLNTTVTIPSLTKANLLKIAFDLPEISTQKQVVSILDRIEGIMKKRQQELNALDDLIKARFVEMFGDPIQNQKAWPIKSLLDMGTCKNGMNFHYDDTGVEIHCLGVRDFQDHSIIPDTTVLPMVSLNEMPSEEYLLHDNDIVFVRSNGNKALVGRSIAVYPGNVPTTFSGFCIRYRKQDSTITIPYLLHVLKADSMRVQMAGRGANIQNLNQQMLASLAIPIPPLEFQVEFSAFVAQIDKFKLTIRTALTETQMFFDKLIQYFFRSL